MDQLVKFVKLTYLPKEQRIHKDLSLDNIIGQIEKGFSFRHSLNNFCEHMTFVSQLKPKFVIDVLKDKNWIVVMHDKLNQFLRNYVWVIVPKIEYMNIIQTKQVFKNKMDESRAITRNQARQVAKGYNQEEDIDYDETFAPVSRLKAVILLIAFVCMSSFKLFQMDFKSTFLKGFINKELYVS